MRLRTSLLAAALTAAALALAGSPSAAADDGRNGCSHDGQVCPAPTMQFVPRTVTVQPAPAAPQPGPAPTSEAITPVPVTPSATPAATGDDSRPAVVAHDSDGRPASVLDLPLALAAAGGGLLLLGLALLGAHSWRPLERGADRGWHDA